MLWPDTSVATNGWPGRLMAGCSYRVGYTSLPCYHTFGGTSKLFVLEGPGCVVDFEIGNGHVTGERAVGQRSAIFVLRSVVAQFL